MFKRINLISFLIVLITISCAKGQNNDLQQVEQNPETRQQTTDDIITEIFGNLTSRGGFAQIVTPEPLDQVIPTTAPQTLVQGNGQQCICVPYHLCDPANNTIRQDGQFDGFGLIDVRFNPDPTTCQHYLDVCCLPNDIPAMPIIPPSVTDRPNRVKGCGVRNIGGIDFSIAGNVNNEAGFGEFPWTIALIRTTDDACLCGGSLIHPNVVLTGTHCVHKEVHGTIKARAGEWDSQTTKERLPYQERKVLRIISHPDFKAASLINDITLLILESPFELADHINTVCLPEQDYISTSQQCFASGWGKDVFGKAGKYSVIMKKVQLPIVDNAKCQSELQKTRLTSKFRLHKSFICAGGEEGIDTCQGDGGAPLVCPTGPTNDNRYLQTGIVAWGIGCNTKLPAVYANVGLFRKWIDTQMIEAGYGTQFYTNF